MKEKSFGEKLLVKNASSLCQRLAAEDCHTARTNYTGMTIAGVCPENCNLCLYMARFQHDDINWIPQPTDKQYHHWANR